MAATDRLGLEFISGMGLAPVPFVELAARLGIHRLGFAPEPIVAPAGSPAWSLRDDPALVRDLAAALAANGVSIDLGEGFLIMPDRAITAAETDIDLFARLGAKRLNAVVLEPDAHRAQAEFAAFAALAAARGLGVTVEFMPHMACGTLAQAVDLVRAAGAANAAVLVDAMHLYGSGATHTDLAALDPALIGHAQLCDARLPGFHADYYDDARCNRPAPGEGVLPLAEFVTALPPAVTIGLELPMLKRVEAGEALEPLLASAVAASRALLTGVPA
ncbi:MAG: sugar phosphate isomerase/epimerase [Sphingomonadales bacterium]|nr:sugar phosphate isomerase/epimerase [Sphingomonadales bacterium]